MAIETRQPCGDGAPVPPLRSALARGDIALHYQPILRLPDGRPAMVEALLRWPPASPSAPERIVALAEAEGLAEALALAVVARAAADMAPLGRVGPRLALSVNLPLGVLLRPDLATLLRAALRGTGLPPAGLKIELTETAPVLDRGRLRRALLRLRGAGHAVLLDDLMLADPRRALLDLPFAGVKLDRSLIEALPRDGRARLDLWRLIAAAERRGQRVIAEGVGTREELGLLRAAGIGLVQGYLLGRPMPAEALHRWAGRWRKSRPQADRDQP